MFPVFSGEISSSPVTESFWEEDAFQISFSGLETAEFPWSFSLRNKYKKSQIGAIRGKRRGERGFMDLYKGKSFKKCLAMRNIYLLIPKSYPKLEI